ncbi:MAG TPA: sigma-70 family RNA polymerase sigma factor [Methylomirabilota bacterium]|jgi:RNA polymerase sigma-70 factor (ECF subfamily)|nr:sigma-70 family RNA polymerase sigma factor [Methylomirabilota bacterium]
MDARTFARASEEYAARLYTVAYRLLGNRADAEDAVQRALLKAFEARESYTPRWALSTWLYRVLTNVCIDELRRRRRVPPEPLPGRRTATQVERTDLARALGTVPREARVLLALHYVNGLSYRELAAIRGISVNTVKSQLARGKAILKQALEE